MRLFYKIASLSLLFGIIHSVLTPVFYNEMNEDWFWFFATGFTLVFSGLMNFFAIYGNRKWMYNICIVSNIIMLTWIVLLNVVMKGAINALVVVFMYLGVTIGSVYYSFFSKSLNHSEK
jgi:hypothetical protein